jgi:hypothetical protein
MPVIYDDRRRHVVARRPPAHISSPSQPTRSDAHPVQPTHVSVAASHPVARALSPTPQSAHLLSETPARADAKPGRVNAAPPSPYRAETLPHAIDRMLLQGYSSKQVEGQIQQWHPSWSPAQIRSEIKASRNPGSAPRATQQPPRSSGRVVTLDHASRSFTPNQPSDESRRGHRNGGLLGRIEQVAESVYGSTLETISVIPYSDYYVHYEAARGINFLGEKGGRVGRAVGHTLALTSVPDETIGLGLDIVIDEAQGRSAHDEGRPIHPIPRIPMIGYVGPTVHGPGVHRHHKVDFQY